MLKSLIEFPVEILTKILEDLDDPADRKDAALVSKRFAGIIRSIRWQRLDRLLPSKANELLMNLITLDVSTLDREDLARFSVILESRLLKPDVSLEHKAIAATALFIMYQHQPHLEAKQMMPSLPAKLNILLTRLRASDEGRPLAFALAGQLAKANKDATAFNKLQAELGVDSIFIPWQINPFFGKNREAAVKDILTDMPRPSFYVGNETHRLARLGQRIIAISSVLTRQQANELLETILIQINKYKSDYSVPNEFLFKAISEICIHFDKNQLLRSANILIVQYDVILPCTISLTSPQVRTILRQPFKDAPGLNSNTQERSREINKQIYIRLIELLSLSQLQEIHARSIDDATQEFKFVEWVAKGRGLRKLAELRTILLQKAPVPNCLLTTNLRSLIARWNGSDKYPFMALLFIAAKQGPAQEVTPEVIAQLHESFFLYELSVIQALNLVINVSNRFPYPLELLLGSDRSANLQKYLYSYLFRLMGMRQSPYIWDLLPPSQKADFFRYLNSQEFNQTLDLTQLQAIMRYLPHQDRLHLLRTLCEHRAAAVKSFVLLPQICHPDFLAILVSYIESLYVASQIHDACEISANILPHLSANDAQKFFNLACAGELSLSLDSEPTFAMKGHIDLAIAATDIPLFCQGSILFQFLPQLAIFQFSKPFAAELVAMIHKQNFISEATTLIKGQCITRSRQELVAIRNEIRTLLVEQNVSEATISQLQGVVDGLLCRYLTNGDCESIVAPLRSYSGFSWKFLAHTHNQDAQRLIEKIFVTSDIKSILTKEITKIQSRASNESSGYYRALLSAQQILEGLLSNMINDTYHEAEIIKHRPGNSNS